MALKHIDQDTLQPDGKRGVPGRTAFTIVNENTAEAEQRLAALELESGGSSEAIIDLQEALGGEVQARADADAAIGARIDGEQLARAGADAALAARMAGKNRLINGDMGIWQRGTAFTASGYTADRWYFNAGGVNAPNLSRNPIAIGTAGVRAAAYAKINYGAITDAANHYVVFEQRIEGVGSLSGDTVAVSFKVFNSGAAGRQIAVEMQQVFGTGGSAAVTGIGAKKYALAAGMNTIVHVVAVPAVAGKTVGANNALALTLWTTGGSAFNARNDSLGAQAGDVHFTEVQVESGAVATGYDFRHPALEMTLAQRFFEKSYSFDVAPGSAVTQGAVANYATAVPSGTHNAGQSVQFKATKRSTPAMTSYSITTGAAGKIADLANGMDLNAAFSNIGTSGFFNAAAQTVAATQWNMQFQWAADSEI